MGGDSIVHTLVNIFSSLIWVGCDVALLIVALGPVKKANAEASNWIAISAGVGLFTTFVSNIWSYGVTSMLRSSSMDSYMTYSTVFSLFMTIVRVIGFAFLLLGVYKLATPGNQKIDPTRY